MRRILAFIVTVIMVPGAFIVSCSGEDSIKVGVLHSLTGTMAIRDQSVVDATLMAIEEINEAGGVLGRKIEPVVVDGRSDVETFAKEADRLIIEKKVAVIFGCRTSVSRKKVKHVVEAHNHLLFYPDQYEGLEQSPNIVYTGAVPNQQIIPAVQWSHKKFGKRYFLVGSDYVYPRTANAIIKDELAKLGGEVVGEEYILFGSQDVNDVIDEIVAANPDVVLSTIAGDTNVYFFRKLRSLGGAPERIPTISFSVSEEDLRRMEPRSMVNDYAAWNYFQNINSPANRKFVEEFKKKYGPDRVTTDPIQAGYFGVYLWYQAVKSAGTVDIQAVKETIKGQQFAAPGGMVTVDTENQHTWKTVRIGKVRADGQFDVVWDSEAPVRPDPFPSSRKKTVWNLFLHNLYVGWDKSWENPGKPAQ
jgi:urea transport system substrate-binding protein